jgi:hypothetical protein
MMEAIDKFFIERAVEPVDIVIVFRNCGGFENSREFPNRVRV